MIPLSNGRSPRIDQFYATLRTYKSYQLNEEHHNRSDQDKSIEHIRSLGKQLFVDQPTQRKNQKIIEQMKNLNKSSDSLFKSGNLYDKYKDQLGKKVTREVNRTKELMALQQVNKSIEKVTVGKKYQQVPSKIQMKASPKLHNLNYAKRADMQAQKLKKERDEADKIDRQMKQKQTYYEKNSKPLKSNKEAISGVLKRTQELQARKQRCAERIRQEELEKQMSKVTFSPQMVSRKINNIEADFGKRISLASSHKIEKQRQLIKQAVQTHSFNPQLNLYRNSDSKVGKLWRQSKSSQVIPLQPGRQGLKVVEDLQENEYKSQQRTANSTVQINIKNLNEISFIFQ